MKTPSPEIQNLARRLLAFEEAHYDSNSSEAPPRVDVAVRVIAELRLRLIRLAGVAGFQSLLSRALTLAQAEAPALKIMQVRADGTLEGFDESEEGYQAEAARGQAGVVLVAHLLDLLVTFIGEALTLRLVHDIWPETSMDETDVSKGGNP